MTFEANFDPKHAAVFMSDWEASGYTIQQLFFLLLEPYLPGSGRNMQATSDMTDLTYRLALELTDSQAYSVFVAQGIFRDPAKPSEEELGAVMRLSDFMSEYRERLDSEHRSAKEFPQQVINEIIAMTRDWPKRIE